MSHMLGGNKCLPFSVQVRQNLRWIDQFMRGFAKMHTTTGESTNKCGSQHHNNQSDKRHSRSTKTTACRVNCVANARSSPANPTPFCNNVCVPTTNCDDLTPSSKRRPSQSNCLCRHHATHTRLPRNRATIWWCRCQTTAMKWLKFSGSAKRWPMIRWKTSSWQWVMARQKTITMSMWRWWYPTTTTVTLSISKGLRTRPWRRRSTLLPLVISTKLWYAMMNPHRTPRTHNDERDARISSAVNVARCWATSDRTNIIYSCIRTKRHSNAINAAQRLRPKMHTMATWSCIIRTIRILAIFAAKAIVSRHRWRDICDRTPARRWGCYNACGQTMNGFHLLFCVVTAILVRDLRQRYDTEERLQG